MSKWFYNTFLPSIYDRCKDKSREMWLSQKQTSICTQNMACEQHRFDPDGYGVRYTHNNYVCNWDGRRVVLSYSKKNGCGFISFGASKEEIDELAVKAEAERIVREAERIKAIKGNPERLEKRVSYYNHKIEAIRNRWEAEKEEPFYDETDAEWYAEEIARYEAKLLELI